MRVRDRALSLAGKTTENITTPADARLPLYDCVDSIFAPAANCMMPEVCSGRLVGFVLKTSNTSGLTPAFRRRASEEVGDTAIVYLNSYLVLEERIQRGPPSFLGSCCKLKQVR
jgi:hypothetical protein